MYDDLSDEELGDELCSQAARVAAGAARLLDLVAAFDARRAWEAWGIHSTAHWLNWRVGIALGAAREQVRVARALQGLPLARTALTEGRLSYSKVRAITRVAGPETEEGFVYLAAYASASQLERIVSAYRTARNADEEGAEALARHRERYVRHRSDDFGMVIITARVSPDEAAVVLAGIEAARRPLGADGITGEDVSAETSERSETSEASVNEGAGDVSAETSEASVNERAGDVSAETSGVGTGPEAGLSDPDVAERSRADALVAMAETTLGMRLAPVPGDERQAVVVHVDRAVLDDPDSAGWCALEEGGPISAHTVRRLACDASVSEAVYEPDGSISLSSQTRRISPRLRRALRARDGGCRWPGCATRHWVDAHHVQFWSDGGRTEMANLILLCRGHHRLVHEGGFGLVMTPSGRLSVTAADGRSVPMAPPPLLARTDPEDEARRFDAATVVYGGESFDLGLAIDALLCLTGENMAAAAASAPT